MSEVVVLVSLTAHPGKEAEGERLLSELLGPTHAEEGCILYSLHRAADDPQRFAFVERWASRELLETHMGSDHISRAMEEVPNYFSAGPEIVIFEPLPGGQETKGSLAGNASG
jgi:quinol monooxygenase YgiN